MFIKNSTLTLIELFIALFLVRVYIRMLQKLEVNHFTTMVILGLAVPGYLFIKAIIQYYDEKQESN